MHQHPHQATQRPFLKWLGGKRRLLPLILPHMPPGGRLVEPFLGAGAVFLGTSYSSAILGDANLDLVAVWTAIKERPKEFVERASMFFIEANRSPESYARIRAEYNAETDSFERAAQFLYLNKFGFNGMHRVNRKGAFNVPYGKPSILPGFPFDEIAAASQQLKNATLLAGGFRATMELAGRGDVVYADPPYADLADQASFRSYTAGGFSIEDQTALVSSALAAAERGAKVLISNHDTALTRELYRGFQIVPLSAARSVSADGHRRGKVPELLAIAMPKRSYLQTTG